MSIKYLNLSGLEDLWINIKNYILSKIPTKTSELTNDSGYLTSHQSLANYVTTNTDQDITGNKNFKGILSTQPDATLWASTTKTTSDIISLGSSAVHVEQKPSGDLTDLSGGAWTVAEFGIGVLFFRINNGADIRYKNLAQNTVNRIPVVSNANRFINDVTPNANNTYSLGTSSLRWKTCYSNAYYLGSTAFGDIVTHNSSEYAASSHTHTKSQITDFPTLATVATSGSYTDLSDKPIIPTVNNATLTIQKNGTTVKTFTANASSNVTCNITVPTKTSDLTNDSSFLTSHQVVSNSAPTLAWGTVSTIGTVGGTALTVKMPANPNTNTTYSAGTGLSLSGTTFSVTSTAGTSTLAWNSEVTLGTVGGLAIKAKLPANPNTDTDTKVTQTVTTGNSAYPVLLCATASATATETTTSRFSKGLTVNARYSAIYMTNKYDTANTKGARNTSSYGNGYIVFRCYDETQMGTIRCESNKGGYQQIYMMASNYIKNGAIDPEGTATTCSIAVRVRDNGSKTIYTDGSWENSLTPYANNKYSLGTSSLQWKNAYIKNLNLNGNAFDPTSIDGVGTVKLLAYLPTSSQEYTMNAGTIKAGSSLGEVWAFHASSDSVAYLNSNMSTTQSGTWKLLNFVSVGGNPVNCKVIGLWVRIA